MALDFLSTRKSETTNTNNQDSFNKTVTLTTGYTDVGNIKIETGKVTPFSVSNLIPIAAVGLLGILALRELKK